MESAVVLAVLVVPVVLIAALRKTPLWWLPGLSLLAAGFACFGQITHTEHGSPVGALEGLGNAMMSIAGVFLVIYGFFALLIAGNAHARAKAARCTVPPLPVAHVTKLPPPTC